MALRRTDALSLFFLLLSDVFLFISLSYGHGLLLVVQACKLTARSWRNMFCGKIIGINGLDLLRLGKHVGTEAMVYL